MEEFFLQTSRIVLYKLALDDCFLHRILTIQTCIDNVIGFRFLSLRSENYFSAKPAHPTSDQCDIFFLSPKLCFAYYHTCVMDSHGVHGVVSAALNIYYHKIASLYPRYTPLRVEIQYVMPLCNYFLFLPVYYRTYITAVFNLSHIKFFTYSFFLYA